MSHQSDLIATDIDAYLEQHRRKELLRLLTCGSVDDGKSTLIGRLLHDSKLVYEDQMAAIERDSVKHGTTGDTVDLALLVDGLKAEREQGITIDVAYRYFSTAKRKFIIADCPGHEQYTRNMATGASTCDLALILVDARKGILPQTRRHSFIVSLLGIKHVLVVINKMDLVDYSEETYDTIIAEYRDFATKLDLNDISFIPISALVGDNVVEASTRTPWYKGATLMHRLETVHIASDVNLIDLRFPVQSVMRPHLDFRGFAGTIASGTMRVGDDVTVLPSGKQSKIASIVTYDGDLERAFSPQAVTVTLEDEVDVSRGDMLVHPNNRPRTTGEFEAMVVWMDEQPLMSGKEYLIKQTTRVVRGKVVSLRYGVDVNTMHSQPLARLELNQIGRCQIATSEPLFHDPYRKNRETGAFIIIDRGTNTTVAAGMIIDRAAQGTDHWDSVVADSLVASTSRVTGEERQLRFGQKPATLLLTGLTGAGKTTIASAVERRLFDSGHNVTVLDGQNIRRGLSRDLAFSADERSENVRRFAEVASLFNESGMIVIGALVAPDESVRQRAAQLVGSERFIVVHLDCPADVCRQRETNGLYERADAGELSDFPGVTGSFEAPVEPDLTLKTAEISIDESVQRIVTLLRERGFLEG